jgi:hypothetical protein
MHYTVYALYLSKPSMETGGLARGKGPIGEGKHPQRGIYNLSPEIIGALMQTYRGQREAGSLLSARLCSICAAVGQQHGRRSPSLDRLLLRMTGMSMCASMCCRSSCGGRLPDCGEELRVQKGGLRTHCPHTPPNIRYMQRVAWRYRQHVHVSR